LLKSPSLFVSFVKELGTGGGTRLHGTSRLSSIMPLHPLVDPRVVRALSKHVYGKLILARIVLTSSDFGNLVGLHSERHGCLDIVAGLMDLALLAKVHVVIPMIGADRGE
jgi:hypothetical protein